MLRTTGQSPDRRTIEVTETAVFDGGTALSALHAIKALGVTIALSEFGTGHSSLGLLRTCPVDTLKIDKSFVDDVTEGGQQAVVAEALNHLSDGLSLRAVAEGVETVEQAEALYRLGYRYAKATSTPGRCRPQTSQVGWPNLRCCPVLDGQEVRLRATGSGIGSGPAMRAPLRIPRGENAQRRRRETNPHSLTVSRSARPR